jgi:hypothetical protein
VAIGVALYLRDQIIGGDFTTDEERALDRFNDRRDDDVIVHRGTSRRLHEPTEPRSLASARVRKRSVLLVVPHDAPPHDAPAPRGPRRSERWEEKRQVAVELAAGPFLIGGTLHVSPHDPITLGELGYGPDSRIFVPLTEATVSLLDQSDWTLRCPTVFVQRPAIDYLCLLVGSRQ